MTRDTADHRTELLEYAGRVAATDDEQTVYEAMADTADRVLAFDSSVVETETDGFLEVRAWSGEEPDTEGISADEGVAGHTYQTGESERVADISGDSRVDGVDDSSLQSVLSVPVGDVGVFQAGGYERDAFDDDDVELAELLASHAAQAVQRIRTRRKLRHERNRFAALFENIPNPTASFVVEDGLPIVRSINPAFERAFGYSAAELAGEAINEYVVPEGDDEAPETIIDTLERGETFNAEVRRITADGPRDFLLDAIPFRLDEPNVHGYAMYTDITERRERERELERQNDRLDEFASIVSHDLRNPLNVARGYLELAEDTGDSGHFGRADDALHRMNDIIGSVLTLAREGRSLDETKDVVLADAAARAWRNVDTENATLVLPDGRVLQSGNDAAVDANGGVAEDAGTPRDSDATTLEADPSRLGSLLENLYRNAVEHGSTNPPSAPPREDAVEHGSTSPDSQVRQDADEQSSSSPRSAPPREDAVEHGGDGVTVTVESTDAGFTVADDGPGIPPERRSEVFESGETTADDGTGFGLAIVESIAEAHGWSISIAESDTGGAKFVFAV